MKQDHRAVKRMDRLFIATFFLPFLGLGLALVGLIALGYKLVHWGNWCTVISWSIFVASYVLRWWVKRWFNRLSE
jgi:hypothetical protein